MAPGRGLRKGYHSMVEDTGSRNAWNEREPSRKQASKSGGVPGCLLPNTAIGESIPTQEATGGAKAGKSPGEDGIPNSLSHKLIELPVILETLVQLFTACIDTGYNPSPFQRSITVVLRK
ncbi:reverse transcriptase [Penicillium bovifimosum]|uniref:Reverse transcriptase n=1 Tax=Penicillium bovifimosum TaxID=126998 RepID=A0A9W9GLV3_9EURO|nr:reverse transcriptase [Penicillium bovifimosum]KAJ5124055.1 reverse transcriptase [Penicillium bovifimosum]